MLGISESEYVFSDSEVDKTFAQSNEIINSLLPQQVKEIVLSLGADRCEQHITHYIFPTICHNSDSEQANMKLYYYFNRKVFICYTECDRAFNIIDLVLSVKRLTQNEQYSYYQAKSYVLNFMDGIVIKTQKRYESVLDKYKKHISAKQLPEYNSNILKTFIAVPHASWLQEGIKSSVINDFNILYSIDREAIVIPYYDLKGRLIGIRVRNLTYTKTNDVPKYCPLITKQKVYSHPLSLSLYGIYQNQEAIKRNKAAILFEGQKSVLLHRGYYGQDSCAVAVGGSNISKPQIDLLVKNLGVSHITVALDKEYEFYNSEKADKYFNKLYNMCQQYANYVTIDFIFDSQNYIKQKDSPIDNGKAVWERLYESRVSVKG